MPTYEYQCRKCAHGFEIVQKFTDDALTQCPECFGELRKIYGNVGVVFKGSGFYATDNRSSSSGRRNGSTKAEGSTSPASSDSASPAPASDAPASSAAAPSVSPATEKSSVNS